MANFFASMEFTDKLLSTNLVTRKLLLPTKSSPLKYNYKESTFIKLWNLSTKASNFSNFLYAQFASSLMANLFALMLLAI